MTLQWRDEITGVENSFALPERSKDSKEQKGVLLLFQQLESD